MVLEAILSDKKKRGTSKKLNLITPVFGVEVLFKRRNEEVTIIPSSLAAILLIFLLFGGTEGVVMVVRHRNGGV